ncbi:MAG: Fe-S-containing protein [Succinivibrio sp.]
MLKYLIEVVESLLPAALVTGLILGLVTLRFDDKRRVLIYKTAIFAAACSFVLAFLKVYVGKINQEYINTVTNTFSIISALLICCLLPFLTNGSEFIRKLFLISGCIYVFTLLFYCLPDLIIAPSRFVNADVSYFSGEYLYKLTGYLTGGILCLLASAAFYLVTSSLRYKKITLAVDIIIVVNILYQASVIFQFMLARRIVPVNRWTFGIIELTANHSNFFIYAILFIVVLLSLLLLISSRIIKADFENPALKRRYIADKRCDRKISVFMMLVAMACVLDLTVIKDYQNQGVVLSECESADLQDGYISIPLERVCDGHLHRFSYTSKNGVQMRFIVIRKNEIAYGVGLDACDICGPTGYYERNGQVVCMRCDVVMNISTIGYRGGCNPVPLSYSVEDMVMKIKSMDLDAEERRFK